MKTFLIALLASAAMMPAAAQAQSVEGRVGKLESEMRAVQRKVFPNGGGQLVLPDIVATPTPAGPGPGVPATSAVTDLTQRVSSLEQQLATMTGQIEQNQFRARQIEESFAAYKRATDERLKALEGAARPAPTAAEAGDTSDSDVSDDTSPARPVARPTTTPASTAGPGAVAGIEKPSTGDAGEDEYMYGYRLWAAKKYPQAEAQLKSVVAKYPKHKRASYAQNLLGRAYLDEGKPSLASIAFYDNYKKMPDGERAPDSLLFLGQALTKLNKPADACKVYTELTDVYGAKIGPAMKADIAKGRTAAKCS
ncbi:hypothetical protein ASE75_14170 [Sphingomonas sp. Leaf17]|uniref:tetratricopeptide repeat protein n=1 Tax=Sphingomonas sp. Leaf17 TaxID=1735683 RepID=UPI0006F593A1|nr:tetratricopeptide repeat protein [Sphingomonas sp. Leaf17]KQM62759.1 hypothetical protein ASE75_14170 [Sphingomonas sp. Leaf17]